MSLSYEPMTPLETDSENILLGKILTVLQGGTSGGGGVGDGSTSGNYVGYNGDIYLKVGGQFYKLFAVAEGSTILLDIAQTPTVIP